MNKHLTKAVIDKAKYEGNGNSCFVVWDDTLPNFGVRIYPTGKKSFVVKYRVDNRQRLMSIGPYGTITLDQARVRAKKMLVQKIDGTDPMTQRQKAQKSPLMASLCDDYIERHAKPRKKTWKKDLQWIEAHILPSWRNRPIKSISRPDISELHRKIGNDRPYLANRILEILSKMFDLAMEWGYLPEGSINPAKRIKKFREEKRDRWVKPDELPKLTKAIDDEPNPYIKGALWLYLLTGVRKSELLKVKWEDIDFNQKELRIPETKSGRTHYVPLSDEAIAILNSIPKLQDNTYLLPGKKQGQHLVNIEKPWRRIRKQAGIEDVRLHDLRRTVGSWLAQSGNSLLVIQKTLNHSTTAATMVYARMSNDPVRSALQAHSKKIMAIAKGEKAEIVETGQ